MAKYFKIYFYLQANLITLCPTTPTTNFNFKTCGRNVGTKIQQCFKGCVTAKEVQWNLGDLKPWPKPFGQSYKKACLYPRYAWQFFALLIYREKAIKFFRISCEKARKKWENSKMTFSISRQLENMIYPTLPLYYMPIEFTICLDHLFPMDLIAMWEEIWA